MRRVIVVVVLTVSLAQPIGSGSAAGEACAQEEVQRKRDGSSEVICTSSSRSEIPGAGRGPGKGSGAWVRRLRNPVPDVVHVPELDQVEPVGLCRRRGSRTVPRQELESRDGDQLRIWIHILNQFPRCPTVQVSPEEVAVDVLERFPLPAPRPSIAPGRAIAGKLAYLEPNLAAPLIGGKPTVQNTVPTALGDLGMTATAVYYVDWGDTETGPHPGPGGPWPDGNITHSWSTAGVYDVEVTAMWTVRWRLGGEQGSLTVPTEGTIEDFQVNQLQAVRNR